MSIARLQNALLRRALDDGRVEGSSGRGIEPIFSTGNYLRVAFVEPLHRSTTVGQLHRTYLDSIVIEVGPVSANTLLIGRGDWVGSRFGDHPAIVDVLESQFPKQFRDDEILIGGGLLIPLTLRDELIIFTPHFIGQGGIYFEVLLEVGSDGGS